MPPIDPNEASARFREFVSEVPQSRVVWTLQRAVGELAVWRIKDDEPFVPLWSSRDPAALCARESFPGYEPTAMVYPAELNALLDRLLEAGYWVGVNVTADLGGIQVSPDRLRNELRDG